MPQVYREDVTVAKGSGAHKRGMPWVANHMSVKDVDNAAISQLAASVPSGLRLIPPSVKSRQPVDSIRAQRFFPSASGSELVFVVPKAH